VVVRVLLVDDDPDAVRLYQAVLAAAGHAVVVCAAGVDAVETAARERFDAVITDFNMPGLKGDTTLTLLHARDPDLPVILLTAELEPGLQKHALTVGAAAFLRKPCEVALLLRTLEKVARK
jgi:two-component system, NtrC family, response regulator GlrR